MNCFMNLWNIAIDFEIEKPDTASNSISIILLPKQQQ